MEQGSGCLSCEYMHCHRAFTFLIGVEDDRVNRATEIISEHCQKREQFVPSGVAKGTVGTPPRSTKVLVGGATVFVLNVEDFKHL